MANQKWNPGERCIICGGIMGANCGDHWSRQADGTIRTDPPARYHSDRQCGGRQPVYSTGGSGSYSNRCPICGGAFDA